MTTKCDIKKCDIREYDPGSPEYQGRLRESIQLYQEFGMTGQAHARLIKKAKLVSRATGLSVQEIMSQAREG